MSSNNNPFAVTTQQNQVTKPDTISESVQAREIQEVQAAMVIAKKFPRNEVAAYDKIMNACTRPTLAENALYQYARGETDITGPSIRMAEMLAQNWGNLQFGIREVDQSNGESTVEAFCWDVENNTRQVKTFRVPHTRYTKRGSYKLEDPRDIYEAVANQGARRLRACILGVIPGDIIDDAIRKCDETLTANINMTPDRINSMVKKFADEFKVSKEQIERRLQRRLDSITPGQFAQLGKIYNSLKDGMSQPGEWFEVVAEPAKAETKKGVDALKSKVKNGGEAVPEDLKLASEPN